MLKKISIGLKFGLVWTAIAVALSSPGVAKAAASPQVCTVGKTCSIGEFLYDDSYVPITSGTCTFTSRNPDGTLYINAAALTSTADGWYAHEFTTPTTEGLYRSQICCTVNSEYLCIDKSFESAEKSSLTQNDVSNAVWNSQRSSHTTSGSFGNALQEVVPSSTAVASAVWGYSGRTLNSFNSLVSDIWANATRTLTSQKLDSGNLAVQSDIQNSQTSDKQIKDIKKDTKELRILLEKQVNKPIIENSIEDTVDLGKKLKSTQEKTKAMYFSVAQLQNDLKKTKSSWSTLLPDVQLDRVNKLLLVVGEPTDRSNKQSLFGTNNWFLEQWDFEMNRTMSNNIADLYKQLSQLQKSIAAGKSKGIPQVLSNSITLLKVNIGEVGDDDSESSLFSSVNETIQLAEELNTQDQEIAAVLKGWKKLSTVDKYTAINRLTKATIGTNRIPQMYPIIASKKTYDTDKEMHNKILSLGGIIKANRAYLAHDGKKSFASTWLELGSIVFKTLISNPSELIEQKAEVKYYLPKEVKKENILNVDEGLTLKLDEQKEQYYVTGSFDLAAGESKVLSVRVTDIWQVSEKQILSLKNQASALSKPLEKTSFFAQGVTIKSDIDLALDKLVLRQEQAETPEEKLVAYRQAQVELTDIDTKMGKLKELVSMSSSTNSLFGFVGATQTLAVWGLILIMSVGFIFLTLSMRRLSGNIPEKAPAKVTKKSKKIFTNPETKSTIGSRLKFLVLVGAIVYGGGIAIASSMVTYKVAVESHVLAEERISSDVPHVLGTSDQKETPSCPALLPKDDQALASLSAQVKLPAHMQQATITDTPTGWLRVRKSPSGGELRKVDVGQSFPVLAEENSWFQIQLDDETTGWVSSKYISLADQKKEKPE